MALGGCATRGVDGYGVAAYEHKHGICAVYCFIIGGSSVALRSAAIIADPSMET